ncbi:MAG TPA: hypothetical protein VIG90_15555 [Pedomonas sp.]|uniref:hypothetical protein n=1 Tax=Pedomonas sp. TaxID=2976421 RepID=UPI002F40F824
MMSKVLAFKFVPIVALLSMLAGCSDEPKKPAGETYTLYRNSSLDRSMRIHWATFDVNEPGEYNFGNCTMAADLLNRNLLALNDGDSGGVLFWCEAGQYREEADS